MPYLPLRYESTSTDRMWSSFLQEMSGACAEASPSPLPSGPTKHFFSERLSRQRLPERNQSARSLL